MSKHIIDLYIYIYMCDPGMVYLLAFGWSKVEFQVPGQVEDRNLLILDSPLLGRKTLSFNMFQPVPFG